MDNPMYDPILISHYFLKNYGDQALITPMKLVKLVYISHGWHLGITGQPLIDENPEAWKYGPVISTVYHHFKPFGRNPIQNYPITQDPNKILPLDIRNFLDRIWNIYGSFSGIELSSMTHQSGTPWFITWSNMKNNFSGFVPSMQIPDNLIRDYYKDKLDKNQN